MWTGCSLLPSRLSYTSTGPAAYRPAWPADLREQLAEVQGGHAVALQKFGSMPDSQLAAMQQQHTADMLQAVADFMRHGMEPGAHHATTSEDGLAAMQRRHTVKLINGLTQYLQRDMQQMQQMCELIAAKAVPLKAPQRPLKQWGMQR